MADELGEPTAEELRKKRRLPIGPHPVSAAIDGYAPGYANPEDVTPCPKCKKPRGAIAYSSTPNMHPMFQGRYFAGRCVTCEEPDRETQRMQARRVAEERQLDVARSVSWNPIPERFARGEDGESPADLATMTVDANNGTAHAAALRLLAAMQANPSGKRVLGFGLYGGKGGGKSHLSYALVRALRASGIAAVIYTLPALDLAVRELFGDKQREKELRSLLVRAPLLVIDDIGKERKSAEDNVLGEFFCSVVDARWLATLPMVVSSNFDPLDLERVRYAGMDRFGAALDRLNGIFRSEWIAVTGASRRG